MVFPQAFDASSDLKPILLEEQNARMLTSFSNI